MLYYKRIQEKGELLMNAILLFIICTTINVVLNTVKSIVTVKGGKGAAAAVNAVCFGFYTYIIILTATADLSTVEKIVITTLCNLVGVYIVKLIEEKMRKDKLWKIEMTVDRIAALRVHHALGDIPHNFDTVHKWAIFRCYAEDKATTEKILAVAKQFNGKTFASETKLI